MAGYDNALSSGVAHLGRDEGFLPDPFDDLASRAMPRTLNGAHRWAQSVHTAGDATYARAVKRVASYFITDIDIRSRSNQGKRTLTDEESSKWESVCRKKIKVRRVLLESAENLLVYGVDFISLLPPFRRYLSCPGCRSRGLGTELPLEHVYHGTEFHFRWSDFEFCADCPAKGCDYSGPWTVRDRNGGPESDVVVRRWSPLEIEIQYDKLRGERAYIWKIPPDYRADVKAGVLHVLKGCNKEVLDAVRLDRNLEFAPGVVHATMTTTLAGLDTKGWPIPPAVINFRQIWHAQVLRRMTEAIAQDHIVPHKVIFPAPRGGDPAADPVFGGGLGRFVSFVRKELKLRERDPNRVTVLPFGIEQVVLGGDANQIAPYQLTEQVRDDMLNAAGVPAELYKGTLSMQAAPAALRLFEAQWAHLVDGLNDIAQFIVEELAKIRNWEPVDAVMTSVTIADNVQQTMAKLQLMMGGQLSQTTGLRAMGVDFRQQQDNLASEQKYVGQLQQEAQEDQQGRQGMVQMAQPPQGGPQQPPGAAQAPPGGGQPAAGGGDQGGGDMGVEEIVAKAKQTADQLSAMPDTQRTSELMHLKKVNPVLHALVKARIEETRQQAQTSGGAQVMAQQQQPKQAASRPPSAAQAYAILRAAMGPRAA